MRVIRLFLLLICLLELSSCDSSIMGSFLNWCWTDSRSVVICYANSTDVGCGAISNVTTVMTVTGNGNYGASSSTPTGTPSANMDACGNQLTTCQSASLVSAYKGITFSTANSAYNYSATQPYTQLSCSSVNNPFTLSPSPCNGPNSASPTAGVTINCSCNDPAATSPVTGLPTCDPTGNGDAASYSSFCSNLVQANGVCSTAYQSCISSATPAAAADPSYGQWVSSNLQISSSESVTINPAKTTGAITLTQPLGLRISGSTQSFATQLQNYQNELKTCSASNTSGTATGNCDCTTNPTSDFCVFQTCMGYDQSLASSAAGYNATCDCTLSANSTGDYCVYGVNANKTNINSAGYSDFANGGKGMLVPFYFGAAGQLDIVSSDPAQESIISAQGYLTDGFQLKQFANGGALWPNQVLTFTVEQCSASLGSPYSYSDSLSAGLPYGTYNGWSTAYFQERNAAESFNIGDGSPATTINYNYWDVPIANSQCSTNCSNSAQGNFNTYNLASAKTPPTYTSAISATPNTKACWQDKAEQIQFRVGTTSWVDISTSLALKNQVWTADFPVGELSASAACASSNAESCVPTAPLFMQFNPNFPIAKHDDVVTNNNDMNAGLCSILNFFEPGLSQPTAIDASHCLPAAVAGGSSGNGKRCYMIISGINDDATNIMPLLSTSFKNFIPNATPNTPSTTVAPYATMTASNSYVYSLYCGEIVAPTPAVNCMDVHNLINNSAWGADNPAYRVGACQNNGGVMVLRGFLGYSCCWSAANGPNVIAGVNTESLSANNSSQFNDYWTSTSSRAYNKQTGSFYTWDTIPLLRLNDIAGLCTDQSTLFGAACVANMPMVTTSGDNPPNSTCYMGNNAGPLNFVDGKTLRPVVEMSTLVGANNSINPFVEAFSAVNNSSGLYGIALYGAYTDPLASNRLSLDAKRACFPYWNDANPSDASDNCPAGVSTCGCPSALGYTSNSDPSKNNGVTKVCTASGASSFACCYNDRMSLTGDAVSLIADRKVTAQTLLSYGPGGTNATVQPAPVKPADLIGGVNVYVKAVPILYTNGTKLQMIISEDDPNKLANLPPTSSFMDGTNNSLPCTTSSASCVAMTQVCSGGKCNAAQPSGNGTVWLKIDDSIGDGGDGYYQNNTGAYNVSLSVVQSLPTSAGSGGLFGSLISVIQTTLASALTNIYNGFTSNGDFATYISFLCEIYIIITVLYYVAGITTYNQYEFLIKVIKLAVVVCVLKPAFASYMLNDLPAAVWGGQAYLIASATGGAAGVGGGFNPFFMFNQVFDFFFGDLSSLYRWVSMFGVGGGGSILAILVLVCCFYYIFALIDALKAYIVAIMSISLMFAMAPIMIPFILFSKTKDIFDNWIKHILQYMLEPVLLFTGLSILSTMVITQLYAVFSDGVCLKCVISFVVGIGSASPFNNIMDLCIPGLLPYGFDNQGDGLISLYFTHLGEAAILFILAMILKKYNEFIKNVALQVVMAGSRSVTGMTSYNNLVDKGEQGGGSLQSFQKMTGLNKDAMAARKGAALQKGMAEFQGGGAKEANTGADVAQRGGVGGGDSGAAGGGAAGGGAAGGGAAGDK